MRVGCLLALLTVAAASPAAGQAGRYRVPDDHPRILFTVKELPNIRARIGQPAFAGHWRSLDGQVRGWLGRVKPGSIMSAVGKGQSGAHRLSQMVGTIAFWALMTTKTGVSAEASAFFEQLDVSAFEAQISTKEYMPRGEYLYGFSIAYDWAHPVISDKARANLSAIVSRNAKINHDGIATQKNWEGRVEANNHSMAAMGAVGLAGIALWGEEPAAKSWIDLTAKKVAAYLDQSFDEDGACYEGNLYGPFGIEMALPFAAALRHLGGKDLIGKARLAGVVRWLVSDMLPGRRKLSLANDSSGNTLPANLLLYGAATYGDGRCVWLDAQRSRGFSSVIRGWLPYRILWDARETKAEPPEPKSVIVRRHRGRGLVNVRSGFDESDLYAAFECGERRAGCHGQADQGNVTLYGAGAHWLIDLGYSNEPKPGSANQTGAHNLVMVDGKGQALCGGGKVVSGKLVTYVAEGPLVAAVGDLAPAYGARKHNPMHKAFRGFLWVDRTAAESGSRTKRARPYVVIVDELIKDRKPHRFESLLHTAAGNEVRWSAGEATISAAGEKLTVSYATPGKPKTETRQASYAKATIKGSHPMLVASATTPVWLCATVLRFGDSVSLKRTVKGGKLTLELTWGDVTDRIVIMSRGMAKVPPRIELTRKVGRKTAFKKRVGR